MSIIDQYKRINQELKQGLAVYGVMYDEEGKVKDYRFLDVNENFETMTGFNKETIIGKTILQVLPTTESYRIKKYAQVALTGKQLQFEEYSEKHDKYYEVVTYAPRSQQLAVIITDISERKRMEKQVFDEKERLKTTLLSAGDGIISTDKYGNVELLNKIAEQLTGWTQEEASGKKFDEIFNIINEFTREKSENLVQIILESGKSLLANHRILIAKQGTEKPVEENAAPIKDVEGLCRLQDG